jgi:serine/threonine protein kinase
MEYCENSDLKKFIEKYKNKNQFIDQNLICSIVLDICSGIKEIHENDIIHRDLKPENIFISHDNRFKIGDFGISKKLNRTKHAKTKGIGTSYYMAPELLKKEGNYDNKVDMWALGCIIYELFTKEVCFYCQNTLGSFNKILEGNHDKINLKIYSPEWQDLIDLLLKTDPNERPDIEEVYNKIKKLKNNDYKNKNFNSSDTTISGISNRDNNREKKNVENCFSFNRMFANCPNLKIVDVSIFEKYYILDYSEMFLDCFSLKTIKLPTFKNENAKMDNMFKNCHKLQKIYVNSSLNINQLKNQLKKDNICPEIIINN